jgi:FixJ family two-component response regulator
MNAESFIKRVLGTDDLGDSYARDQVIELVSQALQESADKRSDFDERRIRTLLETLKKIEETTTDIVAGMTARRARITEDDE